MQGSPNKGQQCGDLLSGLINWGEEGWRGVERGVHIPLRGAGLYRVFALHHRWQSASHRGHHHPYFPFLCCLQTVPITFLFNESMGLANRHQVYAMQLSASGQAWSERHGTDSFVALLLPTRCSMPSLHKRFCLQTFCAGQDWIWRAYLWLWQ